MKFALLSVAPAVHAHYLLTMPVGRSGGNMKDPDNYDVTFWYNSGMSVDEPVLGKNELRTEVGWYDDSAPWRAPGHAEIWSPCGKFCRGDGGGCKTQYDDGNRDGRDLPVKQKVTWAAGSVQEVAFGINTNHGGGYSYRLCKADTDLSEECFGKGALEFDGDTTWVQHFDDTSRRQAIPAKRTNKGKYGSQWTMTPVPMYDSGEGEPFEEYIDGLHGQESDSDAPMLKKVNFVDKVRVPRGLSPGHYVLSFRMDSEETHEVWAQCGDVEIANDGPTPAPSPTPSPSPSPSPKPSGGFCCWYPEYLDQSDCSKCKEKHPEIEEQDCSNENTWCPDAPVPSPTPMPTPTPTPTPGPSGKTIFENADVVHFSGKNDGDSTGWVYKFETSADEQWGRMLYKMDTVDTSKKDDYVHVTFVELKNAIIKGASGTQQVEIVDSVGSTQMMRSSADRNTQHLLNIDTGYSGDDDGEFGVETDYVYAWPTPDWVCLEWNIVTSQQHMALYVDGDESLSVDNWTFKGDSRRHSYSIPEDQQWLIGMVTYNGIEVQGKFKDVVVSTERVGCEGLQTTVSV